MTETLYRTKLLQNAREHAEFLALLNREGVRSYLEIGSMYGGSLFRTALSLPVGSRIVAVDLMCDTPDAQSSLEKCIGDLKFIGYDAHMILGDSAAAPTIKAAADLGPFDCVFIDGAHTLDAVTSDWLNYGPLGRLVAFHDISWNSTWKSAVPGRVSKPMGVPTLWDNLKATHKHREFKYQVPCNYYGIGVLWRD